MSHFYTNFAKNLIQPSNKMKAVTDIDAINKAIDYAINQSEFGVGDFAIIQRRCACRAIRPEKIREYLAKLQADKQIETHIVGSSLYVVKLNKNN